jgi:hypothetical protein
VTNLFCLLGRCLACMVYETAEGVGGKCVNPNCGKVHGWVTRAELRRYAEAEFQRRVKEAA